jgi:hypothetical protein
MKIVVLSALLMSAAVGAAVAAIAPQHGIRGVSLGMSQNAVIHQLGRPAKVAHGTNDLGEWTSFRYAGLTVTFAFDEVVSQVATTSSADRTPRGVGVGSTMADVLARVRGAKCVKDSVSAHCYVGKWVAGGGITDFSLKHGRVVRIVIGRLLD